MCGEGTATRYQQRSFQADAPISMAGVDDCLEPDQASSKAAGDHRQLGGGHLGDGQPRGTPVGLGRVCCRWATTSAGRRTDCH